MSRSPWIFVAATSELEPLVRVAITLEHHADTVANAVVPSVYNARLETMNATVRLMSHRARGFRRLSSLLALITPTHGRVPLHRPTCDAEEGESPLDGPSAGIPRAGLSDDRVAADMARW